ncbi:TMV resistance protein N [Glycine soja]|uniref:TMV resistance protein N n=1 Tax=Glycine soja TaxID=3848 RepID=A0A445KET5_GLYSO|nr:TMV resistance protein N [Glycine soja]
MIKNKLRGKKVLLVLDDVDEHKQLQAIVGNSDWESKSGTRVVLIITTRDKQLLTSYGVKITHEVKELDMDDAIQLLKWKAFKTYDEVDQSYKQVLNDVVTWTSGLPLALEVIGSNLFGKSIKVWESAIKQYQRIPNQEIFKILKAIVGNSDWESKSGTRVVLIITTRDKQLLTSYGVKITHEVKELDMDDAIQLLKWKAFKTYDEVDQSYKQVLNDVVTWTSGLPLALEVIGSNLFGKSIKVWESAIKQYQRIPNQEIFKILKAIVGNSDWESKSGTRVVLIITTRDKQLLTSYGVKITHEVKELDMDDAIQLLKWKAFKTYDEVDQSYKQVLNDVVTWTSGLPLALEVIGSNLFGKSIKVWESAIKQYQRIPNQEIFKILKVSFDALEEEEKSVFLDITCCVKGHKRTEIEDILHSLYDNCMKYHIEVLVDKSLMQISDNDRVTFHDLIENMGKEIDRQKSPKEIGKRRRLWLLEDIILVLEDNPGTSEVKIIRLDFPISDKQETSIEWNAFNDMENLKALIIRNDI